MIELNGTQPFTSNLLLAGLSPDDQALLKPHLTRNEMSPGTLLQQKDRELHKAHFVETGLIAIIANVADRVSSGAGLMGRGAMAGSCVAVGVESPHFNKMVVVSGVIWSIDRSASISALDASQSLRERILRFIYVNSLLMVQMGQVKAHGDMKTRLAFLLLTAHDGLDGDNLALTHELIGSLLGVRRASVTLALHELEGLGFITSTRGLVTIRQRQGLQHLAGTYYGRAEAEYERVLQKSLARLS